MDKLVKILEEPKERKFSGKLELKFESGEISMVNKIESITISQTVLRK